MKKMASLLIVSLLICITSLAVCAGATPSIVTQSIISTVTSTTTLTTTTIISTVTTTKVLYPVENITWIMEAYGDADSCNIALENAEFTLYLDSINGSCAGSVGINSYWAEYVLDGNQLSFPDKQVAVTQLWISDIVKQQQDLYLNILLNSETCEVIDGKLHITGGDTWIIFHRQ